MIHLCYLNLNNHDTYYSQINSSRKHFTEDDLIITDIALENRDSFKCRIMSCDRIDLEYIGRTKLNNIVLFDFEDISDDNLEQIISIKSKKSEILGSCLPFNQTWKKLHLDLQKYKDSGCRDDEISIALALEHHTNRDIMYMLSTNYRLKSNVHHKEISSLDELLIHLKRQE